MASKTIKVSEVNHNRLVALMRPRESFDEVITRLLDLYEMMTSVSETLGPSHYLRSPVPPEGSR